MRARVFHIGAAFLFVMACTSHRQGLAQPLAPALPSPKSELRTEVAALISVWTLEKWPQDLFSENFKKAVPEDKVRDIVNRIKATSGNFLRAEAQPSGSTFAYWSKLEKARVPTRITLNAEGSIDGLLFGPPESLNFSVDDLVKQLQEFRGDAHLWLSKNGEEIKAFNKEKPLAVGSSFKLALLDLLKEQVDQGGLKWPQNTQIRASDRSAPSGFLHTWPAGSVLSLDSLAKLMISQSDNTATDVLLRVLGTGELEERWPRNQPFFSTRNLFQLKSKSAASQEKLKALRAAKTAAEKRAVLATLRDFPIPPIGEYLQDETTSSLEWFFTPQELCSLLEKVHTLDVFQINAGPAESQGWKSVAYKGGSEPGVLNLSTRVQSSQGTSFCLSVTWNSAGPLDQSSLTQFYAGALASLKAP